MDKKIWKKEILKGAVPLPLSAHSSEIVSNHLIVFGGQHSRGFTEELYLLALDSYDFTKIKRTNAPLPRFGACTCLISAEKILIFGGKKDETYFGDLYVLEI